MHTTILSFCTLNAIILRISFCRLLKDLLISESFTNCINFTDKEKHLNPLSTVIYKRPATHRNLLINHKKISLNLQPTNHKNGSSSACGHCALCGNHGTHKNMVQNTNFKKVKTVKLFNLSKTSTALISVYMPLVVIYALKFILVKL